MRRELTGLAVSCGLVAGAPAHSQVVQTSAEEGWSAMTACAALADADERHACTDDVLRKAGLLDVFESVEAQRENFGRSERRPQETEPAAPAVRAAPSQQGAIPAEPGPSPAAPVAAPQPLPPSPPPPQRIERVSTTVAAARIGADRKLLVATSEGAVWRQVSDDTIRLVPEAGTAFEVEEAALGSYRCKLGRGTTYRCQRVS